MNCFVVNLRVGNGAPNTVNMPGTEHNISEKGWDIISNRKRRKEGTICASELAGIKPTPPTPEEQGIPAFTNISEQGYFKCVEICVEYKS